MPYHILENWIKDEKESGAPNPCQAILSTLSTDDMAPHSRVVAIREINDIGLLFFTQKTTRKVLEIKLNPNANITFWFELKQRQVIIEGVIEALSDIENEEYWNTYPKQAKIRFNAYASTSSQRIASKEELEKKKNEMALRYEDKEIPLNPLYCGFRLKPHRFAFYAFQTPNLSDTFEYVKEEKNWVKYDLSP